jgi:hypothetical protein
MEKQWQKVTSILAHKIEVTISPISSLLTVLSVKEKEGGMNGERTFFYNKRSLQASTVLVLPSTTI